LRGIITDIGFIQSEADECVFVKPIDTGQKKIDTGQQYLHNHLLCIHVDDIYSSPPTAQARIDLEKALEARVGIKKQHGKMSYLGMAINKDKDGTITANQNGYIQSMLDRFNVTERPVSIPARPELLIERDDDIPYKDRSEFISIIMCLMYLARMTRGDTLFPVTYLATKCRAPTVRDYLAARWVLRYIKGTKSHRLVFKNSDLELIFHSDASHLLHEDGHGHTGIIITIGGTVVMARSIKQKLQARSSAEAELIAAEECSTYVVWMRLLCRNLGIWVSGPSTLSQDNKSAVIIANNGGTFKRTKHMIGKMSYLKDRIRLGDLVLKYVPTRDMLADMFTKPATRDVMNRHTRRFGLVAK